MLKAAGFSLADIGRVLSGKPFDLARLIGAQLAALDAQAASIGEARRLLLSAKCCRERPDPTTKPRDRRCGDVKGSPCRPRRV